MAKKIAVVISIVFILFVGIFLFSKKGSEVADTFNLDSIYQSAEIERAFQSEPENRVTTEGVKIPIFIYHSIRPFSKEESKIEDAFDITPELFEKQLAYLRDNGYTAISFDELVKGVLQGTTSPVAKPVILSIDDGWANQYRYAFPILKKYHMTATFFIPINPIGKKHFLTWEQVKEMDSAGMTIASHTLNHPYLAKLSAGELKKEISDSKKVIEEKIKKPVLHFASPFGFTSPEVESVIKEAGYATGRTTYRGVRHSKGDLLRLRGVLVSDNFDDFISVLKR